MWRFTRTRSYGAAFVDEQVRARMLTKQDLQSLVLDLPIFVFVSKLLRPTQ